MSDRQTIEKLVESCNSKTSLVSCPHRGQPASITAAKWQTREGRSTPWVVVDCPFLAAGTVSCDMSCLPQLDSKMESPKRSR
jgi:hypothetical protein